MDGTERIDFEVNLLKQIAQFLGEVSLKGIENTIRFQLASGLTNIETWHSHFQHNFSLLFCLRGDKNAQSFLISANELMKKSNNEKGVLLTKPQKYLENEEPFSLIKKVQDNYEFSSLIFDRSDFEEQIPNLDLPDAEQKLKQIQISLKSNIEVQKSVNYLFELLEDVSNYVVYKQGDMMIVNEQSTIRYSSSYELSTEEGKERWLIATSISK